VEWRRARGACISSARDGVLLFYTRRPISFIRHRDCCGEAVSDIWMLQRPCGEYPMGWYASIVHSVRLHISRLYSCSIETPAFASSGLLIERNTHYANMRYILRSGNKKAVSEHEHATVLLEQQLIAISKQAQQARHESFTTAARQTQFGSCDPVPRLYLTPPQIDRLSVLRD
jgi:hypothetical protein